MLDTLVRIFTLYAQTHHRFFMDEHVKLSEHLQVLQVAPGLLQGTMDLLQSSRIIDTLHISPGKMIPFQGEGLSSKGLIPPLARDR